ncbi:MAG: DUF5615 family PIN-like protein [Alphaproteobacteria bacterium]|nr:DUF5615 family PIN-like protein [Alphaproteobacteria bacterium]
MLGPDPGDRALLAIAAEQQRILVTIDKDLGRFVFSERTAHAGIIRLPDLPALDRIALMDALLAGPHAGDLAGNVVTVEIGRARIARPNM